MDRSRKDALRRRREREREHLAVRLLSRERLVCISVACVIGNALILYYTLPSCHIDAKSIYSLAFAALFDT